MNILATQYTLVNRSFEIYLSGCSEDPKCLGCYNPEAQNFDIGEKYTQNYFNTIRFKVENFSNLIDNIIILGGEPLDQDKEEFKLFATDLKKLNKLLWLFTRFEIDEISSEIKKFFDYIKTGRYLSELKTENNIQYGIKLATSNQKIYKKGIDY
jgi:anaerobic ribonucleoside-triphosphate reductase activating protein